MYKVIIGDKSLSVAINKDNVVLDGKPVAIDLARLDDKRYHLLLEHKSYNLEIISIDRDTGHVAVKVNNKAITVTVKTALDELLQKMGLNNNNAAITTDIGAPMPGLILDVVVQAGDEVKKGDTLLVLEAMKMENIIKSPGNGKIKAIPVKKGDSVDSGQKLILFE